MTMRVSRWWVALWASCALVCSACKDESRTEREDRELGLEPPVQGPPPQQSQKQGQPSTAPEAANRRIGSPATTGNGTEQDSNTRAATKPAPGEPPRAEQSPAAE